MFRLRRAHTRAGRTAAALRAALPDGFVVLAGYEPRDGVDRDAGIVVVGPTGVHVIEPREAAGGLACHQDAWYRVDHGVLRRIAGSPSQEARENAARVRSDISSGGYIRMPVDGAVLVTGGPVTGAASASVPILEGIPAAVAFLEQPQRSNPSAEQVPAERTRALVAALLGPSRLATA